MEKTRYTIRIWRRSTDEYDQESKEYMGEFITWAYSARQAFSNICYRERFRNYSTLYEYIDYVCEIVESKEN